MQTAHIWSHTKHSTSGPRGVRLHHPATPVETTVITVVHSETDPYSNLNIRTSAK